MINQKDHNMYSNKKAGRVVGLLFLLVFILGIIILQFLQGPVLFLEDFMAATAAGSDQIIISVLLSVLSGVLSIIIAIILLPIFKKHSYSLAFLYVAFCILNFIAIMLDNVSVIAMLELSQEYVKNGNSDSLQLMGALSYQKHRWTHYLYLLISCFPVFVLYYTLYLSKLVPRVLSIFGIIAVVAMFIEVMLSLFRHGLGMDMLLPIALIQLTFPLWLIFKGLNTSLENSASKQQQ